MPGPRIEAGPRPDLVHSRDVVTAVQGLLSMYSEQQGRLLEGEVLSGSEWTEGNYSSASELRERRLSSLMYLIALVTLTAITMGGLVLLARQVVELGAGLSFALWAGFTGALSLLLVAGLHSKELGLTREGLEHHKVNAGADLAGARVDVQREIMLKALDTQTMLAQAELETRRAQRAAHEAEVERLRLTAAPEPPAVEPTSEASELFLYCSAWLTKTLERRGGEYVRLNEDGRLRKGESCPLAERGGLTESQRQRLAAALEQCSPWLVRYEPAVKSWHVNTGAYPTASLAVRALEQAW